MRDVTVAGVVSTLRYTRLHSSYARRMVALCGLNDRGVSVAVNNLGQLNHAKTGLPVAMMIRALLAQPTHAAGECTGGGHWIFIFLNISSSRLLIGILNLRYSATWPTAFTLECDLQPYRYASVLATRLDKTTR